MGIKTITAGSECVGCKFYTLDESDKSKLKVKCAARDKIYSYGQRISCEDKEKVK